MREVKTKNPAFALQTRTFQGKSGSSYLVFRTPKGQFHVFVETAARPAAQDCGSQSRSCNPNVHWQAVWDKG